MFESSKKTDINVFNELEKIIKLSRGNKNYQISKNGNEFKNQLTQILDVEYLKIKSYFSSIEKNLDPEIFFICLKFFTWFSSEFQDLKLLDRDYNSKDRNKKFFISVRNLAIQLARFSNFIQKL